MIIFIDTEWLRNTVSPRGTQLQLNKLDKNLVIVYPIRKQYLLLLKLNVTAEPERTVCYVANCYVSGGPHDKR